jgi:hypothetical protein
MLQKIRFVLGFFDKKDPKLSLSELLSIVTRIQFNPTLFIWPSMWTRLEHAYCLETINNMWFLGKRESVNAWKKANLDDSERKRNRSAVSSKWNKCRIPYFTDYRSMGTIGRIAAFRLNFLGNTKIGRSIP